MSDYFKILQKKTLIHPDEISKELFPKPGPFLRIFQWRGQLRKGTSGRKGKVKRCSLLGALGVLPQKIFVFLSSLDVISCNFSMIFAHFQTKRDITRGGGAKPFPPAKPCPPSPPPPSIYVKKGPVQDYEQTVGKFASDFKLVTPS